jgi:hypothetical protein
MKKLFFSFVMMLALVIVAGTAMAQTSTTPYLDATYSYSISAISPASANAVEIYITSDAAGTSKIDPLTNVATPVIQYTLSSATGATLAISDAGYNGTLSAGTVTFNLLFSSAVGSTFASADGLTPYYVWIKAYSGDNTTCSNLKYLIVTPQQNNFDLAITASADVCQKVITPTAENIMGSVGQYTEFTYTVNRTGGNTTQLWSFDLTLSDVNMTYLTTTNTVELVGVPSTSQSDYNTSTGLLNVKVNADIASVVVTFRILTTPGAADNTFTATLTNEKLWNPAGSVVLYTDDATGDNDGVVLKLVPFIGTFVGVD